MRTKYTPEERRIRKMWMELSGYTLWEKGLKALSNYVELVGFEEVEEAVIIAAERDDSIIMRFRYCCGILKTKLARKMDPSLEAQWKR